MRTNYCPTHRYRRFHRRWRLAFNSSGYIKFLWISYGWTTVFSTYCSTSLVLPRWRSPMQSCVLIFKCRRNLTALEQYPGKRYCLLFDTQRHCSRPWHVLISPWILSLEKINMPHWDAQGFWSVILEIIYIYAVLHACLPSWTSLPQVSSLLATTI